LSYARRLSKIIEIEGRYHIATLGDAREFLISLPKSRRGISEWEYAAELLMKAARQRATPSDVNAFERQFLAALNIEVGTSSRRFAIVENSEISRPAGR
jgi:hypothetical protein